jgi:3-oxoacyl-[acyl-carrier protein] reductase
MDLGLAGRTAVVSGASSGMGLAIARALADEGANVMLFARREELLAQAVAELGVDRAASVAGDSTDPEAAERLVAATRERFGGIDVLVNNTGGPRGGTFGELSDEDWTAAFELAVMSAIRLTRLALPDLRASGRGRIVNISGYPVLKTEARLLLSSAVRRSVIGWAMALAREEAANRITINSIAPGYIDTGRLRYLYGLASDPEAARAREVERIPAGRFGRPEEIAATVAFLCSEQAAYMTGETLLIDGGLLA